jgi:hypothetical protein
MPRVGTPPKIRPGTWIVSAPPLVVGKVIVLVVSPAPTPAAWSGGIPAAAAIAGRDAAAPPILKILFCQLPIGAVLEG